MTSDRSFLVAGWTVMILWVIVSFSMLFWEPIHIDEAITFRHFVSQGWKISLTTYPFPNNHVLFSVLASFAQALPLDPIISMRLVSWVFTLIGAMVLYRIVKRTADRHWALVAIACWLTSLGGMYYAVHGRGYGLQTVLMLIALDATLRIVESRHNSLHWFGWIISSALGFFTIPTFLFPFTGMAVMILYAGYVQRNIGLLKNLIMMGTAAGLLTVLLYGPLFHYSGINAVTGNQWTQERQFTNLTTDLAMAFFPDLIAYVGISNILMLLVASGLFVIGRKGTFGQLLPMILVPVLMILAMRSLPFPRTFVFLTPVLVILVVDQLQLVRQPMVKWGVLGLSVVSLIVVSQKEYVAAASSPDHQARDLFNKLTEQGFSGQICTNGWNETADMLDFHAWRIGGTIHVKRVYDTSTSETACLNFFINVAPSGFTEVACVSSGCVYTKPETRD